MMSASNFFIQYIGVSMLYYRFFEQKLFLLICMISRPLLQNLWKVLLFSINRFNLNILLKVCKLKRISSILSLKPLEYGRV